MKQNLFFVEMSVAVYCVDIFRFRIFVSLKNQ